MIQKNSILNRRTEHVTVRRDMARDQAAPVPGRAKGQWRGDYGYGEKLRSSREEIDPDMPASYYKRRGIQQPPPFAYKYPEANESAPRPVLPPAGGEGGELP